MENRDIRAHRQLDPHFGRYGFVIFGQAFAEPGGLLPDYRIEPGVPGGFAPENLHADQSLFKGGLLPFQSGLHNVAKKAGGTLDAGKSIAKKDAIKSIQHVGCGEIG